MAGGGGTSGGRVLLGAEPPGTGVEILSTVAELGQGHALIWKGLGEGGQDTVSPRAQWMQLRVDGQAEHVGDIEQFRGEFIARPRQNGVLGRLLTELVVEGHHDGGGRRRIVAHRSSCPQSLVDSVIPEPRSAQLVADLPGIRLGQPGDQRRHSLIPGMGIETRHRLGVADLNQGQRTGGVQSRDGLAPRIHLTGVRGVINNDPGRHLPLSVADADGLRDLSSIRRLGEGDADDRVGRRESLARLVEGELSAGRRLQRLGPAGRALRRVGGRGTCSQGGSGIIPQGPHLSGCRRIDGIDGVES